MALSTRVRDEAGFGLVELLIAMTVMVVGITALVAALSSGMVAVKRAGDESTAAAVADVQMEAYRKVRFDAITPTCPTGTSASTDCFLSSSAPGADGRSYPVATAIRWDCPVGTVSGTVDSPSCSGSGAERPVRLVTIIVHDPSSPAKTLFRATSTFDQATG